MIIQRTLLDIINSQPQALVKKITDQTDVEKLCVLKKQYAKTPDVIAIINARIENLNYLVV